MEPITTPLLISLHENHSRTKRLSPLFSAHSSDTVQEKARREFGFFPLHSRLSPFRDWHTQPMMRNEPTALANECYRNKIWDAHARE
jgi:hypothetical protein